MSSKCLFLFIVAFFAYQCEGSDLTKSTLMPSVTILKKFVDLVETHRMKVSIISSKNTYGTDGQLIQVLDNALLLPTIYMDVTKSEITHEVGKQWISDAQTITKDGRGVATFRVINVDRGNIVEELVESSSEEAIPVTPSYQSILSIQNGVKGYISDWPNWQTTYNFKIPTSGNEQNIEVIAANLKVNVVAQTGTMSIDEIKMMVDMLPVIWLKYGPYLTTIISKAIEVELAKQLPHTDWVVAIGTSKLYVDATKSVTFEILDQYITIFA